MKINSARFVSSLSEPRAASEFSPQVCVAGRSNCGKSTLLNLLMGVKLCKTSQTPGRTRLINIFEVNASTPFYFVDLPGYGYSKAAKRDADEWNARTEGYFTCGNAIAQTLCLMDIRRDPSDLDKVLINFLRDMGLPFTVVLTKADKLSGAQTGNAVIRIASALGLARDDVIVTSALNKKGRDAVLNKLENILTEFGG